MIISNLLLYLGDESLTGLSESSEGGGTTINIKPIIIIIIIFKKIASNGVMEVFSLFNSVPRFLKRS